MVFGAQAKLSWILLAYYVEGCQAYVKTCDKS